MSTSNTPDPTKSKLELSESEAVDWVSYGSSGSRIMMTLADLQALAATSDPALQALVERAKKALNVTEFQRDVYILAQRRAREGELEIDEDCAISMGEDDGAYISTWTWINFTGTPLDAELAEGDEEEVVASGSEGQREQSR